MSNIIYRLTLDENGQDDCRDFTDILVAEREFKNATRRKTVFSAHVYAYSTLTHQRSRKPIYSFER